MAQRLIPFRFLPAAWGLRGLAYDEAEIDYLYSGREREERLAHLHYSPGSVEFRRRMLTIAFEFGDIENYQFRRQLLELDLHGLELRNAVIELDCEFGNISEYDGACAKLNERVALNKDNADFSRAVGQLEIDRSFGRISQAEFDKGYATLRNEPWISVVNAGFDPHQGIDGVFFEFDWNAQWIDFLRANGYTGHSEEQIVDEWFSDVCRSHVQAEMAPQ